MPNYMQSGEVDPSTIPRQDGPKTYISFPTGTLQTHFYSPKYAETLKIMLHIFAIQTFPKKT